MLLKQNVFYMSIPIRPIELRLGNLIFNDIGLISQVSHISLHTVEAIVDDDGSTWTTVFRPMPIPLKMEMLTRFGFTYEYTNGGWRRWQKGDFKLLDGRLPHPQFHSPKAIIQYAHELQNLYFDLTHEELR